MDLPGGVRAAFSGWEATQVELPAGTQLYRIHTAVAAGGNAAGNWWMTQPPTGEIPFRIDYAVLPQWNLAQEMSTLTVAEGQTLTGWIGNAGYVEGFYIGGGQQVWIPSVPTGWVTTGPVPWQR